MYDFHKIKAINPPRTATGQKTISVDSVSFYIVAVIITQAFSKS
jgi:hypothetical protein